MLEAKEAKGGGQGTSSAASSPGKKSIVRKGKAGIGLPPTGKTGKAAAGAAHGSKIQPSRYITVAGTNYIRGERIHS
eukprot:6629808-Pyramimonas_sp.AAC.1